MKKIIIMIFMLCTVLVGCSSTDLKDVTISENGIAEIRFKDMIDVDELRKLDGKSIKMVGFFAQSSPLDGSMVYLMNMPYQNCVYCLPNTNQLMNTMAVYPKAGKKFDFTDLPVEIVGKIKFENITDEMGYSYEYRIVDAEAKIADVEDLSEDVKIYTDLINKGFADKISNLILLINNINTIEDKGKNIEDAEIIPESLLSEIDSLFNNLDKSKYEDILAIVSDLKILVQDINKTLISKDYDNMEKFKGKELEIFYRVYDWLMKAEL